MVEPISLDIGTRPVGTDLNQVVQAYNRELIPLVKAMRRAINDLIGASDEELIVDADISDTADINVEKLGEGTDGHVVQTIGTNVAWGFVVNDNVDPDAEIAVSKLANGNDGDVLTTSGTSVAWAAPASGDVPTEFVHPFQGRILQPPSASSSFQDVNTEPAATSVWRTFFDASLYPSTLGSLNRSVYIEAVIASSNTNSAQMKVINQSDGEDVSSTTQSHNTTTPTRYLLGPLTVGTSSGNVKTSVKEYRIQGRHLGVSALLQCFSANFVIRYA